MTRKWKDQRVLLTVIATAITFMIVIGCTTRPEVSETLQVDGNHTPGELYMVTADTSSDGYHYLEPQVSPDLTRVIFTADWSAIPTTSHPPSVPPEVRQLIVTDLVAQDNPITDLSDIGARLVRFNMGAEFGGAEMNVQKGTPRWIDGQSIVFWVKSGRGARLYRVGLPNPVPMTDLYPELLYAEPDDDELTGFMYWEHRSPAISPDRRWLAFSRFGYDNIDSLHTHTDQSIWVMRLPEPGVRAEEIYQVTGEASMVDQPSWSPDGSKLVFHATSDLVESDWSGAIELFVVDFDTTGISQNGVIELNQNITQLTDSEDNNGSPIPFRNLSPSFSSSGQDIVFISDRRVPTITLREKNIWTIPADGSLDPSIMFFSRYDDVDVSFVPGDDSQIVISSGMGYPSEMLDRIEQEAFDRFLEEDPAITRIQAASQAASMRMELEFFEGVMSHIMVFSPQ